MRPRTLLLFFLLGLLTAITALGQGVQTATLNGKVTSDGAPLPGVTVTATSPAMIGSRVTVTAANGDYVLRGLPPGEYKVTFEMEGLQTVEVVVMAPLGTTSRADAELAMSVAAEAIIVTADAPNVLETTTVSHNTTYEEVQALPVGRTPTAIAALAGGVTGGDRENRTPVANQLSINGGMAYDNSFLVNGVNVQDPIFGQTNNLFIEEAIQETQVLTSGISAEYGAFTGGVLNVITKSGSNEFSGSIRADYTKPDWRDETPYEKGYRGEGVTPAAPTKRTGDLAEVYSLTLGGRIIRDRLWFFGAVRDQEASQVRNLSVTGLQVPWTETNQRWEVKLTGNLTANHSVQVSYVDNPVDRTHEFQLNPLELSAIGLNSSRINDGLAVNYNGVITSKIFAEARYSEKTFGFRGLGGTMTNIQGSPFRAQSRHVSYAGLPGTGEFGQPYFDATDPENRDNEQIAASLSYYLSTGSLGSHDIKGGFESFTVTRTGGNSQSSTGYVFYTPYLASGGAPVYDANGAMIPRFVARSTNSTGYTQIINWVPTRGASLDITTDSYFFQDRWDINQNWSANIGARYEVVDSKVTGADLTSFDTDTIVPRLAVSFDPLADGRYRFDLTYAGYAGRYNPSIANVTPVGSPGSLTGYYDGPEGSGYDFAPGFDLSNYVFYTASVPGVNVFQEDGLHSPVQEELSFSAGMALPKGGWAKLTFIDRKLTDFIEDFILIENGCTEASLGGVNVGCLDNQVYANSDGPERAYQAVMLQSRYAITPDWLVEGNYTYQIKNDGNYEGEGGQSFGATPYGNRPELESPRNNPTGRLAQYQEHKFRLWTTYVLRMGGAGNLTTGFIFRYDSPQTFSYSTSVPYSAIQIDRDPGYKNRPVSQTLFFGERGAGEFASVSVVDVSLNYEIPLFGGKIAPWVKFDVTNVMNDDTLLTWNTSVSADAASPKDEDGLATGYTKAASFGRPTGAASYVVPREYLVAVGIRF